MISTRLLFEFSPAETKNIITFLKPTDQTIKDYNKVNHIIEFECNGYTTKECMLPLIEHIAGIGNVGHSFEIVVDPESSENKRTFGFDGDGSHQIKNIKVNSVDLKNIIKGKY